MTQPTPDAAPPGARRDRPAIVEGYQIEPSAEGLLPWSFVRERLAAAHNYWVATTRPDGRPHVAPVWGLWSDETFYFSTDPTSRKARNFAAMPAIAVHLESGDEAVILEGRAERVIDPDALRRFVEAYDAKYGIRPDPGNPSQGVFRLRLRTALAWREADYQKSPTRWRFE